MEEELKAKKSLGQNFLKSESALIAIVGAANIDQNDTVLEIGPGKGALTEKILASGSKLIAIEKDNDLIDFLTEKFSEEISTGQFELINMDILEFDESKISSKYKLIANIPYYITGLIIRKFLSAKNQPEKAVLLVQKEVAERIVSRPEINGSDKNPKEKENLLSLSVKIYSDPKLIKKVPAGSFVPAPKIDSAIIALENINKNKLLTLSKSKKQPAVEIEDLFFELIHAGFAHKRKTLLKNLKKSDFLKNYNIDFEEIKKTLVELKRDPKVRAEDLTLSNWLCLIEKVL
jgi:16S rRNA (adenine1518-N6/adenine1519-N6)-dimethyltransferase